MTPDAPIFARHERWRSWILLPFGVAVWLFQQSSAAYSGETARFEIASLPISQALDQYSLVTGRDVFYDGALAAGRRSNPIRGDLASDAALRELLVGTGLTAKPTGTNSFTLKLDQPARVSSALFQSYFAEVQTRIAHALCARAETRPADHDRLIRIWVGAGGGVERAQLVNLSQVEAPAREIALRGLPIGAPPADMPQPVVMAILAGTPSACGNVTAERSR